MSESLRVRVLKRHIKAGKPESSCSCPIAQAVREVSPKKKRVSVSHFLTVGKKHYDLPKVAIRFIDRFDAGKSVKPITFTAERQIPWTGVNW